MSVINFPILYIPDPVKGRPLFDGQIFVGEPDLDPEIVGNQKQLNVVEEDGTIVPVSQPFVLSAGGVPVYNGNPVRLDVDGNYSFKILSKLGAQTYYIENVFEGQPVTQADLDAAINAVLEVTIQNYTLAEAVVLSSAVIGQIVQITDRSDNQFEYVLASGVTPNGLNIVQCTGAISSFALVQRDYKEKASSEMYRRSLVHNVGAIDAAYTTLVSTYTYTQLFPTALAVDESANELFIARTSSGGVNDWAWVWVYHLDTGEYKTIFTFEDDIWEGLVIRYDGATRYIYSQDRGDVTGIIYRADITALPAEFGTAAKVTVLTNNVGSQLTFDGKSFFATEHKETQGRSRRNDFNIYDVDFNLVSSTSFPMTVTGTFGAYEDDMAKSQSIAFHKGKFYFGTGTTFFPTAPVDLIKLYSGIQSALPDGTMGVQALCRPDEAALRMKDVIGHDLTLLENEGIYSDNGNLYALWVTLNPPQWDNAGNEDRGVSVTLELSDKSDRVDFGDIATAIPKQFNLQAFSTECHHSDNQLTNPITLDTLDTFQDIIDMMLQLQISTYQFYGTNQVITDVNAAATPTTGSYIKVTNTNGDIQIFEFQSTTTMRVYKTTGKGAGQTVADITFT